MSGIFDNYKFALLDASFFFREFPENVKAALFNKTIYIADTFDAEIAQYQAVLPSDKSAAYISNISFLNSIQPVRKLDMASFGETSHGLHNDTWGLLQLFIRTKAEFVLVTADQLLIQRVIVHDLAVDIFDLSRDQFILYQNFAAYRSRYVLNNSETLAYQNDCDHHVAEGTKLYRANGTSVVLQKQIKEGGEAKLFLLGSNPSLIAKIFHKGRLTENKFQNILKIEDMNRRLGISWALFPIDVLYYDTDCTVPAGFTEAFAETDGNIDDNPLYLCDVDLPDTYLNTRISSSLELCLKVVRQVHYLNSHGFLVSDFNKGNFALCRANDDCLQMWDTDSFGYETFFSGYCDGNGMSREYDISKKEGVIDFCCEALHIFVFSILALGDPPINENSGKFKYDNPNYPGLYRKDLFPANLWRLFVGVFRGSQTPSLEVLLQQLHIALENCKAFPSENKTYKELLTKILAGPGTGGGETGGGGTGWGGGTTTDYDGGYETANEEGMGKWLKALLVVAAIGFVLFLLFRS